MFDQVDVLGSQPQHHVRGRKAIPATNFGRHKIFRQPTGKVGQ
jgi:hypothetical protein